MSRRLSRDFDVRAAVVAHLLERGTSRRDIRHEITLDTSSSGGRADVVVLTEQLCAVEIKSGSDRLDRLRDQMKAFRRSFDRVSVAIDKRHVGDPGKGPTLYHPYDVYCHETGGFITWYRGEEISAQPRLFRDAPRSRKTSMADVCRLLWRTEAMSVAARLGYRARCRETAIEWMRENARLCDVRPLVISELRARVPNRWEDAFWAKFDAEGRAAA